jgi:hypothetical protein
MCYLTLLLTIFYLETSTSTTHFGEERREPLIPFWEFLFLTSMHIFLICCYPQGQVHGTKSALKQLLILYLHLHPWKMHLGHVG